jgi:hypothetical protein
MSNGSAFAQSKDVAYYCVSEVAGGLWYNEKTKKWEGVSFRPESKFVLKMIFLHSNYDVTVTEAGKEYNLRCSEHYGKLGVGDQYKSFSCTTAVHDYRFNFVTNRFLAIYAHGYVDGKDNDDNTPGIEGGTCTKIQ